MSYLQHIDWIKLVLVVLALWLVVYLVYAMVRAKQPAKKENFRKCICSEGEAGRERVCQDTVTVNNLYVTNELTEFSKLPNPGWSTTSPGDVNFPISKGCGWSNSVPADSKGWAKWDFTDFGN